MSIISRKELKREFQQHHLISSLSSMRLGFLVTLILFSFFMIFNRIFFPEAPEGQFYNRLWIMVPMLILCIGVSYLRPLHKNLNSIYFILNTLLSFGIFIIGYQSDFLEKGYEFFYAWVMLVIIGLFSFFRVRFFDLVVLGLIQVLSYASATLINGTFSTNKFIFFNNLFFVLSIYSIGFLMAYAIRNLSWKNFLHQRALSNNYKKLLKEIEQKNHVEKELKQSEIQYHNTLNSIPDWIYVVDKDLRIVLINSALESEHQRQGYPADTLGKKLTRVYPYIPQSTLDEIRHVFNTGETVVGEQKFFLRDKSIFGETHKVPIFKEDEVVQVMTILRDRSKAKEVEELKLRNAEQKEVMLREIHHRVKNNLAIVISLLNLQLRRNNDPELTRIIQDIEMRIRSMALIHEHLYRSENLDRIPLDKYLQALIQIIITAYHGNAINLTTSLDPIDVTIETALPLGLIVNELLTNSYKYAFPGNLTGKIDIELKKTETGMISLMIRDNGVGLPDDFSIHSEKSLGIFIVNLLVEQLDANISVMNHEGACFLIEFRNNILKDNSIN